MVDRIGEQLGAYMVLAHVADGSMGSVYEARHRETGERVAVKVLRSDVARDPVAVQRFGREYETAKSLRHGHILEARDFGQTVGGAQFMTMEFLEGEELSSLVEREGPMRPARAVRVVCQIALALHHAHDHGVIHRDLKPDNIFVCAGTDGDEIRIRRCAGRWRMAHLALNVIRRLGATRLEPRIPEADVPACARARTSRPKSPASRRSRSSRHQ